jgi:hypothetical protein
MFVARFHLSNGARLERINWLGNTELRAIQESFGIMVNYLYDHDSIENNYEAFVRGGTIVRSPGVDALMQGPAWNRAAISRHRDYPLPLMTNGRESS